MNHFYETDANEQDRYLEWCEEREQEPMDHWSDDEDYADFLVARAEDAAEERIERGEWGRAYLA